MSVKKIQKGFKDGGLIGAVEGVEADDIKKLGDTIQGIGDAVSAGGEVVVTVVKKLKEGIEQRRVDSAQRSAMFKTNVVKDKIRSFRSMLEASVKEESRPDWATLLEDVLSSSPPPSLKEAKAVVGVPRRNPINTVRKENRGIRSAKEAEARELHERLTREYDEAINRAKMELARLKSGYEMGDADAIEFYIRRTLRRSTFPRELKPEFDVAFEASKKTVVVDFVVPPISCLPDVSEYRYDASVNKETAVPMSQSDLDELYEDVLYQLCLKCLYTALSLGPASSMECAVFNGWVPGVDSRTGQDSYSCVLSCMVKREEFASYNLSKVSSKDCFRHLQGVCDEPLARLAPVDPIMRLNKRDSRFMESMKT